ncbi:MAG TPA: DUF58 domain-containing protein [Pseudonocardia sp.]
MADPAPAPDATAPDPPPDGAGLDGVSTGPPSGITTLGRCLIAAGLASAVCSVVLDERDLLRVGVLVIVLPVLAAALASRIRVAVRAERTLEPTRITAGTSTEVTLLVDTPRWLLGGGLVLTDALPDALGGSPVFVAHAPRRGDPPSRLNYPITPAVRGVHSVGPLTVRAGDPLGLAEYERVLTERTTLTVLPRVTPLTGVPDGFGRGEGDAGASGLRWGPGEHDVMVRGYQPGDPLRSVHWRSTARHDELMVRIEEQPWHGGVTVLLDRRSAAHVGRGASASLEWAIELVASVCAHLIRAGRRVTLVAENGVTLAAGRNLDELLEALAMVRPSAQPGLIAPPAGRTELFAVLGAVEPAALRALTVAAEGGHGHAVLLDVPAWATRAAGSGQRRPPGGIAAPSRTLADAGWTVLVGRPERAPDQLWLDFRNKLSARSGSTR